MSPQLSVSDLALQAHMEEMRDALADVRCALQHCATHAQLEAAVEKQAEQLQELMGAMSPALPTPYLITTYKTKRPMVSSIRNIGTGSYIQTFFTQTIHYDPICGLLHLIMLEHRSMILVAPPE